MNLGGICEHPDPCEEGGKTGEIGAADLESGIDKNIGNIVVAGAKSADEAVQTLITGNAVALDIDESRVVVDVKCERVALFNADDVASGR